MAGVLWLPRLIDKVRAFQAGTLGAYAYPSALDQSFMRHLRFTPADIEVIVRDLGSDQAIAATLRRRIPLSDEEVQTRCAAFRQKYRWAFAVLDRDDGYVRGLGYPLPQFLQRPLWRWYQRWSAHKANATAV